MDSKPAEVIEHGLNELGPATLRVEIFVAQDQSAILLTCTLSSNPESSCVAEVQQARGGRSEAAAVRRWVEIAWHCRNGLSGEIHGAA